MAETERQWVPTKEAMRLSGFVNMGTFRKVIRARRIQSIRGRRNLKLYSRAKMLELAREREAAEKRQMMGRNGRLDPLNAPETTGELEASVFQLFDERVSPVEVVKRLKLTSAVVDHLFESWWRMQQRAQAWLNPSPPPAGATAPTLTAPAPLPPSQAPVSFAPPVVPEVRTDPVRASETRDVLKAAREAAETARKAAGT